MTLAKKITTSYFKQLCSIYCCKMKCLPSSQNTEGRRAQIHALILNAYQHAGEVKSWSFRWGEWNLNVQLSGKGHLDTYCSLLWTCPRLNTKQIVALRLCSAQQWPWRSERSLFSLLLLYLWSWPNWVPTQSYKASTLHNISALWHRTKSVVKKFVYLIVMHLTCLTCLCNREKFARITPRQTSTTALLTTIYQLKRWLKINSTCCKIHTFFFLCRKFN